MTNNSDTTITQELRRRLGDKADEVQDEYDALFEWMLKRGKNPRREMELKWQTADNYIKRLDQLHRFNLTYGDPDVETRISSDEADTLLYLIDQGDITKQKPGSEDEEYGESAKRKFSDSLQKYFSWRYHEGSANFEWQPKINFSDSAGNSPYRFTFRELGELLEAAETYGSLPSYYDTPAEERERIDGIVAQRLGIVKNEVTREDWQRADWSSKVDSLVNVGHDAGLAPVEIRNAETQWYDAKNKKLEIPTEQAYKQRKKQEVALSDAAAEALSKWDRERRHLSKYDGTNKIWLNRDGNPYQSGSLCNLIRNLCEDAGVQTENRRIVWYSLRQTMGDNLTDEGELSESNDQLRQKLLSTTQEQYNTTPVEKRRARLNSVRQHAEHAAEDPEYNPYEDLEPNSQSEQNTTRTETDQPQYPDETDVTSTGGGNVHVDAFIEDTTSARAKLARRLLDDNSGD